MKKNIFILVFLLTFSLLSYTHAAMSFSHPVIQKAYELANKSIDQKTTSIPLDTSAEQSIKQKKEKLSQILLALDEAIKKRDTTKIKSQAKLFRDEYKGTLALIETLKEKRIHIAESVSQNTGTGTEISGTVADITHYSDIFEGRKTANGNTFSQSFFSAARCDVPFNTLLQVGKGNTSVIVKANDRPNCSKFPNVVDLSKVAFEKLGNISTGRLGWVVNTLGTAPKNYTKAYISPGAFQDLGITLDSGIPNTYLKNETLHITGKELSGKEYTILYLKSPSGKDITLGMKKSADNTFEYHAPLEETGTYQMVLASGLSFNTSTFLEITVLEDSLFSGKKVVAPTKAFEKLDKLNIERRELPDLTALYLFHFASSNELHTLVIKSGNETFLYRGFETIALKSDVLRSIDATRPVSVEVFVEQSSTAFSHDTYTKPVSIFSKTMPLVAGYKEEKKENIFVWEEAGKIVIRGIVQAGKNVKNDIVVTLPDGNIERYTFGSPSTDTDGYMKRGVVFEKTIPLKQTGVHLLEINYDNGFAAYNGPVISGDVLPAYPNEYDTTEKEILNTSSSVVATESLAFVNTLREISGKPALSLDTSLNTLATIKANDMATHSIVSHNDSFGEKIDGTAKRHKVSYAGTIGENVAGGNISYKILLVGLSKSGGHRANMLDTWSTMGVGYAVKDGQVYYVQVFGE